MRLCVRPTVFEYTIQNPGLSFDDEILFWIRLQVSGHFDHFSTFENQTLQINGEPCFAINYIQGGILGNFHDLNRKAT